VLPVNALAMGLAGSAAACLGYRLLGASTSGPDCSPRLARDRAARGPRRRVLGFQPEIAHTADGQPLFFPFGLSVTLPAVVLPHLILAWARGCSPSWSSASSAAARLRATMRDRLLLIGYAAAVIAATSVHDPRWLAAGLGLALLAAGRDAPRLLRRTLLAMLAFSAVVSVGYVVAGLLAGNLHPEYLIRINIRVCLLTFLTSLLVARVDFLRALNYWRPPATSPP